MTDPVTRRPETAAPSPTERDAPGRVRPGKRVRVVLAERRAGPGVVRTRADVEEQTTVGELFLRQLVTAQLVLAVRLAALTVLALGAIPVMFYLWPQLGAVGVWGVRLPWVLLGVAVYPFLLGVGWAYVRSAERHERDFVDVVDRSSAGS